MEKQFSQYLKKIGIIDEEDSLNKIKTSVQLNDKNFINSSFYYLMHYFDNLTEQQKKFMSFYIPAKYKLNSEENKKNKIKSIIIQRALRQNLIKLKYFYLWKKNMSIFKNSLNNRYITSIITNNNNKIKNEEQYKEKNLLRSNSCKNKNTLNLFDNENDNKFNLNLDLCKEEYSIENIDSKPCLNEKNIGVEPINKLQQISQNTQSLEELFAKTVNNKKNANNKNKKNEISNIKNIYNYNTINIRPYQSKNIKNNRINKIKTERKNKNISDIIKYSNFRNQRKNRNNKNEYTQRNNNCNKKYNIITSLEEKEMEELKECTFRPKINTSHKHKALRNIFPREEVPKKDIQSTFDKLYSDNEKYKLAKELKTIDYEYMLGKNISFTPNLSNFRKSYSKNEKNFEERQMEYLFKKNKNNEELKNKIDYDDQILCSFNPKICEYYNKNKKNKEKSSSSMPVFQRLYQDCEKRKNSKEKKEIENINKFNTLSKSSSQKRNINYEFLNKLYENNREDIINKIKEKIYKEKGITFKPNIEQNNYLKNVNGTFLERNEKWINEKKNFYEEEKMKQIENLKKNLQPKEYTKEEKKQIINNIINRLYKKGNENDEVKKSKEE